MIRNITLRQIGSRKFSATLNNFGPDRETVTAEAGRRNTAVSQLEALIRSKVPAHIPLPEWNIIDETKTVAVAPPEDKSSVEDFFGTPEVSPEAPKAPKAERRQLSLVELTALKSECLKAAGVKGHSDTPRKHPNWKACDNVAKAAGFPGYFMVKRAHYAATMAAKG